MIELNITVDIIGNADEQTLDDIAWSLQQELNELNIVESVEHIQTSQRQKGDKGSSMEAGKLLIKIAETSGFVSLVGLLASWLGRDKNRTLKLQIGDKSLEVTGLSKSEQSTLIDWFQIQAGLRLEK